MRSIIRYLGGVLGSAIRVVLVAFTIGTMVAAPFATANYFMTQGAGTEFGSIIVGSVHYAQQLICDFATPATCAKVRAGNTAVVSDNAIVVSDPNTQAAINSGLICTNVPGVSTCTDTLNVQFPPSGLPFQSRDTDQYPVGATAKSDSDTGTTAATASSLAAVVGKTNYVCGFSIRANATAAKTGNATLTGTITGTLNFTQWTAPTATGLGVVEMIFTPCLPASATNTALTLTSDAPGTGGVVSTAIWGYDK